MRVKTAAGTTCVVCRTDRTVIQWYDSKDEPENKMCRPCYDKNLLDVAAAEGTTCVKCGTDTTNQWYNCKDEPGTKICKTCYGNHHNEKKKAASANDK
jgi:hypothetical protein